MKKITMNLLATGVLAVGLLASCSSENTTGVETGDVNSENDQSEVNTEGTEPVTGDDTASMDDTYPDTTYQNPPTNEQGGNQENQ